MPEGKKDESRRAAQRIYDDMGNPDSAGMSVDRMAEIIESETGASELAASLQRTLANFMRILGRQPVRDASETIAEAESVLAKYGGGEKGV
jgi:hypothetical protein